MRWQIGVEGEQIDHPAGIVLKEQNLHQIDGHVYDHQLGDNLGGAAGKGAFVLSNVIAIVDVHRQFPRGAKVAGTLRACHLLRRAAWR